MSDWQLVVRLLARNVRCFAAMGSGVSLVAMLVLLQVDHLYGRAAVAGDGGMVSATLSNQNYATYLNKEQSRWNAYSAPLALSQTSSNAASQGQPQ